MSKGIITSPAKGNNNATSGKKPASKLSAKKAAAANTIVPSNCVTIRIGSKVTELAIADLDQSAVRDLAEQIDHGELGTAPVELGVGDYTTAPPTDRGRFWHLYQAVRGDNTRQVTIRVGDKVFVNAADWAANTLADLPTDPEGRCRALELTADVLAHACRPPDRDVYLDAAVAKLRERGYAAPHCEDIRRNVRQRLRDLGEPNAGKEAKALSGLVSDRRWSIRLMDRCTDNACDGG